MKTKTQKTKTHRQVGFLLSKGSPLKKTQKDKLTSGDSGDVTTKKSKNSKRKLTRQQIENSLKKETGYKG